MVLPPSQAQQGRLPCPWLPLGQGVHHTWPGFPRPSLLPLPQHSWTGRHQPFPQHPLPVTSPSLQIPLPSDQGPQQHLASQASQNDSLAPVAHVPSSSRLQGQNPSTKMVLKMLQLKPPPPPPTPVLPAPVPRPPTPIPQAPVIGPPTPRPQAPVIRQPFPRQETLLYRPSAPRPQAYANMNPAPKLQAPVSGLGKTSPGSVGMWKCLQCSKQHFLLGTHCTRCQIARPTAEPGWGQKALVCCQDRGGNESTVTNSPIGPVVEKALPAQGQAVEEGPQLGVHSSNKHLPVALKAMCHSHRCDLCGLVFNGPTSSSSHYRGKAHAKKVTQHFQEEGQGLIQQSKKPKIARENLPVTNQHKQKNTNLPNQKLAALGQFHKLDDKQKQDLTTYQKQEMFVKSWNEQTTQPPCHYISGFVAAIAAPPVAGSSKTKVPYHESSKEQPGADEANETAECDDSSKDPGVPDEVDETQTGSCPEKAVNSPEIENEEPKFKDTKDISTHHPEASDTRPSLSPKKSLILSDNEKHFSQSPRRSANSGHCLQSMALNMEFENEEELFIRRPAESRVARFWRPGVVRDYSLHPGVRAGKIVRPGLVRDYTQTSGMEEDMATMTEYSRREGREEEVVFRPKVFHYPAPGGGEEQGSDVKEGNTPKVEREGGGEEKSVYSRKRLVGLS